MNIGSPSNRGVSQPTFGYYHLTNGYLTLTPKKFTDPPKMPRFFSLLLIIVLMNTLLSYRQLLMVVGYPPKVAEHGQRNLRQNYE